MYNLLVALAMSLVVFALVGFTLGWVPAAVPATLVFGAATYLLTQRMSALIEPEVKAAVDLLQNQKVEEAKTRLRAVKQKYGPWQLFISGQMDAQLGMIAYIQTKFEEALPLLEAGSFQNQLALTCIGAIHWRNGKKDAAYKQFEKAADANAKETSTYMVWAVLAERDGKQRDALAALDRGLKVVPNSKVLKDLRDTIANRRKVDTAELGEVWFQFFPEDYLRMHQQNMVMTGRKDGQFAHAQPQPGGGTPKPTNRAQRRAAEKKKA